jgi:hypothetical protein
MQKNVKCSALRAFWPFGTKNELIPAPFIGGSSHRMLRTNQNDRMPITMSSKLTVCPWPTLQRAKANLMLISTCTRKKKTRYKSSFVCIYMACCRGSNVLFHQAYPEMRKMIMKMRSIQAQIRFILTRSRPLFKANSPCGPLYCGFIN